MIYNFVFTETIFLRKISLRFGYLNIWGIFELLPVQSQQKNWEKMWNLFKVNNNDTRTPNSNVQTQYGRWNEKIIKIANLVTPVTLFWCFLLNLIKFCLSLSTQVILWTYVRHRTSGRLSKDLCRFNLCLLSSEIVLVSFQELRFHSLLDIKINFNNKNTRILANICLFKVNSRSTRKRCEQNDLNVSWGDNWHGSIVVSF